jgi:hypothetical protein
LLQMIGTGGKLSESAVSATRGSRGTILVGGLSLEADDVSFSVNSPYLDIDPSSLQDHAHVGGVSVISFELSVDPATPSGIYSIFATSGNSQRSVLIGAIHVQ